MHPGFISVSRDTSHDSLQSYRVEDTLDVEIHDFPKSRVWMRVEALAPRSTGIGHQNINMFSRAGNLLDQLLDLLELAAIGRYAVCLSTLEG
jgi:hypothetical protein